MEENNMDLRGNGSETGAKPTDTDAIPEQPQDATVNQATAPKKKPTWKKVLIALWDIVVICAIAYGINHYLAQQIREQFDDIAVDSASSALTELNEFGISFTLIPVDKAIPKAETYEWEELREGGGKAAMAFQMVMYSDDFPEVIKTGKDVKYMNFTHTVEVYVMPDGAKESQHIGDVEVVIIAFYQGYGKNGMLYLADPEVDTALGDYISSYADTQEQQIFEQSFVLQDSSVDYSNETITICYDWTNLRDEDAAPMWSFDLAAYQGGYELQQDYYNSETDPMSSLAPGYTGNYSITYYLRDNTTPVKLVVSNKYGANLFEEDPPVKEFEISLPGELNSPTENGDDLYPHQGEQAYSDINALYKQFQKDIECANLTDDSQSTYYSGEEVRNYRNYDAGEELAELTLHDFGGYGEVTFYALGQDILQYHVTLVGSYACSGYTVDYFQFTDFNGEEDLFIFRSGNHEWLVTWNAHHEDGIAYTHEA